MAVVAASTLDLAAGTAQASLVLVSPENFQGSGLGSVNSILTMSSPGNSSTETAAVGLNPGGTQFITGVAGTGASQTQVRSISSPGVGSAADLRVVFNATEPHGANNGIKS